MGSPIWCSTVQVHKAPTSPSSALLELRPVVLDPERVLSGDGVFDRSSSSSNLGSLVEPATPLLPKHGASPSALALCLEPCTYEEGIGNLEISEA